MNLLRRALCVCLIALVSLLHYPAFGAESALTRSRVVKLQSRVKSASTGYLSGRFPVTVGLYKVVIETGKPKRWEGPIWSEYHESVTFENGFFKLEMGSVSSEKLTAQILGQKNLEIGLEVADETFYFPMSSVPYVVQAGIAEGVISADASKLDPSSVFKAITLNASLSVGDTRTSGLFVNAKSDRIQIGTGLSSSAPYKFNVKGEVNAKRLFLNGVPLADTFDWQRNPVSTHNIYFLGDKNNGFVGINDKTPKHRLAVEGVVNVQSLLRNGRPISAGLEWQRMGDDLIFVPKDKKLGVGTIDPRELLEVQQGIKITKRHNPSAELMGGAIWFDSGKFYGFDGTTTNSLIGLEGVGGVDRIGFWESPSRLSNSLSFVWKNKNMGVGTNVPSSLVSILPDSSSSAGVRISSGNSVVFFESPSGRFVFGRAVIPPKGFMAISGFTPLTDATAESKSIQVFNELVAKGFLDSSGHILSSFKPEISTFSLGLISIPNVAVEPLIIDRISSYRSGRVQDNYLLTLGNYALSDFNLKINGGVSAADFRIYGRPLRFAISRGSEFMSDRVDLNSTQSNIFYMNGNVSIGQPESGSLLQVASPFKKTDIDVPTKDPVIGFRYIKDATVSTYLFGVDADGPGVLRVEKSESLGSGKPLFVALDNQFGVGTLIPKSNLHVSGNYGFIVKGQLNATPSLSVVGPGVRMLFQADKGAFRAGYVSAQSRLLGADWDPKNMGVYSVALGQNNIASGNYSTTIGGSKNFIGGAYATGFGGVSNTVDGYFALGMGYQAVVPKEQHGSFVWADKPLILSSTGQDSFSSSSYNQFVIRSDLGVGIGTNDTLQSALTVQGRKVLKSDFMKIFPNTDDLDASVQVWTALRNDNYITAEGYFSKFMPRFYANSVVQVFPVTFIIPNNQLYSVLTAKYRSSGKVLQSDFTPYLNLDPSTYAFSKSVWIENEKSLKSLDLWKWLVEKQVLNPDSTFANFNPSVDTVTKVAGSNLVDSDSALYGFLVEKFYHDGKVSAVAFKDLIKTSLYLDPAFDNWVFNSAKVVAASKVFSDLVSNKMIRSNGNFDAFRPIFDFNQTLFHAQRTTTTNIFNVLLGIYDQNNVKTLGNRNASALTISNGGRMGVGYSTLDTAALAVNGPLSIGTTQSLAKITIQSKDKEPSLASRNYALAVFSASDRVTPSVVINTRGMVGVKQFHDSMSTTRFKPSDNVLLAVDGAVIASGFNFTTGESLSVKPPHIDWLYERTTPNIYFVSGNVGIGTASPNSLLELSNRDDKNPVIGFDLSGTDYYGVGLAQGDSSVLRMGSAAQLMSKRADLTIKNKFVGINTVVPSGSLHVSGNVVTDYMFVATASRGVARARASRVYVNQFLLKGSLVLDWVWGEDDISRFIYTLPNSMKVGIGKAPIISETKEGIDVAGTGAANDGITSANYVVVSKVMFAKEALDLPVLTMKDGYVNGSLFVRNKGLWLGYGSVPLSVSEVLSFGQGMSGALAVWDKTKPNMIGRTPFIWTENANKVPKVGYNINDPAFTYSTANARWVWNQKYDHLHAGSLILTGNVSLVKAQKYKTLDISNSVQLGIDRPLDQFHLDSTLTYEGGFFDKTHSFSVSSMNIRVKGDVSGNNQTVIGSSVTLSTDPDSLNRKSYLTTRATAFGLVSDVSQVNAQVGGPTTRGFKFPGIFMGDVGIGGYPERGDLDPKYSILDVKGPVQAISFDITDRMLISTINVNGKVFYVDARGHVGIDVLTPLIYPLAVKGVLSTNYLNVTRGLKSQTLSARNDRFVVDQGGFVGIGSTAFSSGLGQFEIYKLVSNPLESEFNFQRSHIVLNAPRNKNVTGLDLKIGSASTRNIFASGAVGTGIDVSFTNLSKVATGSTIIGVRSQTTSTYNAVFMGGAVGIGTTIPEAGYLLDVRGVLRAHDLVNTPLLHEPDSITFANLFVSDSASFGVGNSASMVTMNSAYVGNLKLLNVSVSELSRYKVGLDVRNTLFAKDVWATRNVSAKTLISTNKVIVSTANFSQVFAVGNPVLEEEQFGVKGGFVADTITVNQQLLAQSMRVSSSRLVVVDPQYRLGIRVASPSAAIDSMVTAPEYTITGFSASNNTTWYGARVQSNVSNVNHSVGLEFQPGNDAPKVGLLAVKQSGYASDLAVVAGQAERLRLTASGNLGIGQLSPEVRLAVVGSANISNMLNVSQNIFVSGISGLGGLAINQRLYIRSTADFSLLSTEKSLDLFPMGQVARPGFLPLYTSNVVPNHLMLGSSPMSASLSLSQGSIPYYGTVSLQAVSTLHKWDAANREYQLASPLYLVSSPGTKNITNFVQKTVAVDFKNRTAAGPNVFYGTQISAEGTSLHQNDVFTGLNVDLSKLQTHSQTVIENSVFSTSATKYVATFRGGGVGIAPYYSPLYLKPSANLHIVNVTNNYALNVYNSGLVVSSNGFVGVGQLLPRASLDVSGSVYIGNHDSGKASFVVSGSSVGIGGQGLADLDVKGDLRAKYLNAASFMPREIRVATSGLVVKQNGHVGIGLSDPTAQLQTLKILKGLETGTYAQESVKLRYLHAVTVPNTAFLVNVSAANNNYFGGGKTLTGFNVDYPIAARSGSKVMGIAVQTNATATRDVTAIFQGGYVGIGLTNPAYTLDVVGDLKGRHFSYVGQPSSLSVLSVTANSDVYVSKNVQITGDLNAQKSHLFVNHLLFVDQNNDENLVSQFGSMPDLGMRDLVAKQGFVSGSVTIGTTQRGREKLSVVGNVVITRNMIVKGSSLIPIKDWNSVGSVTVSAPRLYIPGFLGGSGYLGVRRLHMTPTVTPNYQENYPKLFVSNINSGLYFLGKAANKVVTINLTSRGVGTYYALPYFDSGDLQGNSFVQLKNSELIIGANSTSALYSNQDSMVLLSSYLNKTSDMSKVALEDLRVGFARRVKGEGGNLGTLDLAGLDIVVNGDATLHDGDRLIGVSVNVTNLIAQSRSEDLEGPMYIGEKYSGLFLGGSVAVVTSGNRLSSGAPSANLHIRNTTSRDLAFAVRDQALTVSVNYGVGVGTSDPRAALDVSGSMKVTGVSDSSTNSDVLVVQGNTVGIGGVASSLMGVKGSLRAKRIAPLKLNVGELVVATKGFVVKPTGFIGMGLTNPAAQLDVLKQLNGSYTDSFVFESMTLVLNKPTLPKEFESHNAGLKVNISSAMNNTFGNTNTVVGISVKQPIVSESKSKIVGISVQTNTLSTRDVAAVFRGGRVGIGVDAPEYALDVNGDLRATSMVLTDEKLSSSFQAVTVNNLVVTTNANFPNATFVLRGQNHIRLNELRFRQQNTPVNFLSAATKNSVLNMDYLTAVRGYTSSTLNVGVSTRVFASSTFHVGGDALFEGIVSVNGTRSTLNVSTIGGGISTKIVSQRLILESASNSYVQMEGFDRLPGLILQPTFMGSASLTAQNKGWVYLSSPSTLNYAIYKSGKVTSVNILGLSAAQGSSYAASVPYLNKEALSYLPASGNAKTDLVWQQTSNTFSLRNEALTTTASMITSYIKPTDVSALPIGSIALDFGKRLTPSNYEFYGLNLVVSENGKNGGTVLPDDGKVIGLKVDMSRLYEKSSTARPSGSQRTIIGQKYAAIFKGGAVGIVATGNSKTLLGQSELLHVTMNNQTNNLPFMVESKDFLGVIHPAMTVTRDGTVALGFRPLGSEYRPGKTSQLSTLGLSLLTSTGAQSLLASTNVKIGTGALDSSQLSIFSSNPLGAFRVDTASTKNVFGISPQGSVLIGGARDGSTLVVSGNSTTVFEVSTRNVNRFYVQKNGQVRILFGTEPSVGLNPFALSVSGDAKNNAIVMSGDNSNLQYVMLSSRHVAGAKRVRDFYSAGFASTVSDRNLVFGITSGNVAVQDNYNARFAVSANRLVFSNYDGSSTVPVMTILTGGNAIGVAPKVGMYVSEPLANVHLQGLSGKSLFQVSTSNNWGKKGLSISEAGHVSIGTTRNDVLLSVSGNVVVNSIRETPLRATLFKTVNLVVSQNGSSGESPFVIDHAIENGKGHTAASVELHLVRNLQLSDLIGLGPKDIAGMVVSLNSNLGGTSFKIRPDNGVYGLKVDISNLINKDAQNKHSDGFLSSAVFLSTNKDNKIGNAAQPDAKVGIGTNNPTAPLDVMAFNNKTLTTTGNIAAFNTKRNYLVNSDPNYGSLMLISTFGSTPNFKTNPIYAVSDSTPHFFGPSYQSLSAFLGTNVLFNKVVMTPESFQAISYKQKASNQTTETTYKVNYEQAAALMDILQEDGVLKGFYEKASSGAYVRIGAVFPSNAKPVLTRPYYAVGSLFIPSSSVIAVLNQHYYRSVFSFKTFDTDDDSGKFPGQAGFTQTSPSYNTLVIATGTRPIIGENGFVNSVLINGGADKPDASLTMFSSLFFRETLQVGGSTFPQSNSGVTTGDMRLGAPPSSGTLTSPGPGAAIYFSGGPYLGTGKTDGAKNSENTDEIIMRRHNKSEGENFLKIEVGEDSKDVNAGFIIGISKKYESKLSDSFIPLMAISAFSLPKENALGTTATKVVSGLVGIGTTSPQALLHVYGKQGNLATINDSANRGIPKHLVTLENISTGTTVNTLAISYSSRSVLTEGDNFISFLINSNLENKLDSVGAIEGNPGGTYTYTTPSGSIVNGEYEAGGVAYSSPERDYAEYVEKLDPKETFVKGDVVGIFGGKVSHKTVGADHVMVISSTPIVVGNWQSSNVDRYALVAFLGQVPVRVRGVVNKGDYLIPSGKQDGVAVAVSPSEITSQSIDHVLGRSWNESHVAEEKTVVSIIGFPFGMENLQTNLVELRKNIDVMSSATTVLESELKTRYEKRQQLILDMKKQLTELKN